MLPRLVPLLILAGLGLSACNSGRVAPVAAIPAPAGPPPAAPATPNFGPVLGPDGRCTGAASGTAAAIEPGISECDLVRLKGKPATDVLVGEGKGRREVQVLYSEPGGRELYFFVDNGLDRIVKP
ncbi:hypothetical protein [Microvirga pudoricolor]|uniref:hypothetical protein n=1 Tax=Microvirga pudoricolor TaxID=2778729 RepID=UPI00194FC989|nr:hypothetical protein [Microvirga pudoricolor]MBM6594310.1 hypothetical protein [Microvirga pudoricolor]